MAVRIDCGDGYVNVSFARDEQTPLRHATAIRRLVEYLQRREAERSTREGRSAAAAVRGSPDSGGGRYAQGGGC